MTRNQVLKNVLLIVIQLVISVAIMVTVTQNAFAAEVVASGECGSSGDNVTWVLDDEGTITLSGTGEIKDYDYNNNPFLDYKDSIKKIEIGEGITAIGKCFCWFSVDNDIVIELPESLERIGDSAFQITSKKSLCVYMPSQEISLGSNWIATGSSTNSSGRTIYSTVFICDSDAYIASEASGYSDHCLTYDELEGKAGRNITYSFDMDNHTLSFSGQGDFYSNAFSFPGSFLVKSIQCDSSMDSSNFMSVGVTGFAWQNVESIKLPSNMTTVADYGFSDFQSLKELALPQSVTQIGGYAFRNCYSLEDISLPSNLNEIPGRCFYSCKALREIDIPDSVETVGPYAFYNCQNLERLSFVKIENEYGETHSSNSCTIYSAFAGCQNLRQIDFSSNVPNLTFDGTIISSKVQELYFPSTTLVLGANAFKQNDYLKTVVIKATIVNIGNSAFAYSKNLDTIRFEGVTGNSSSAIDASAFDYVDSVTIYGYAGTAIESFANSNNIQFIQLCDGNEGGTHKYSDWITTNEATCTEAGLRKHTCEACGYVEEALIDPLGHSWDDEYTVDQENTCTETGSKSKHCKRCNSIDEDSIIIIEPKGHDWFSDYTVDKEASCTEAGSKSIHCKICGDIKPNSKKTIEALGHAYAETVIEPTCSQKGHTLHVCGRCGDSYTDTETSAKGHTFGDWHAHLKVFSTENAQSADTLRPRALIRRSIHSRLNTL